MKHHLGIKHLSDRVTKGEAAAVEMDKRIHILWLDRLALAAGTLGPLTALPQLRSIIVNGTSAGVSLWTWLLLFITSLIWTAYGLTHREKLIIISSILWLVLEVAIVFAIIIYP
ncbi:MAG: SemiSWEET family transporter [Candidatus Liptonbacteria bacterium]